MMALVNPGTACIDATIWRQIAEAWRIMPCHNTKEVIFKHWVMLSYATLHITCSRHNTGQITKHNKNGLRIHKIDSLNAMLPPKNATQQTLHPANRARYLVEISSQQPNHRR